MKTAKTAVADMCRKLGYSLMDIDDIIRCKISKFICKSGKIYLTGVFPDKNPKEYEIEEPEQLKKKERNRKFNKESRE